MAESFWRRCSTCKRDLAFGAEYYACSVSTCNRKGNAFVFCSVNCWEVHVPTMRHREAWAEARHAPSLGEWNAVKQAPQPSPPPSVSASGSADSAAPSKALRSSEDNVVIEPLNTDGLPHDVLIVASKLKAYVRARSGLNTSDTVLAALSDRVRALCDDAIVRARHDGRKTVMDRDF